MWSTVLALALTPPPILVDIETVNKTLKIFTDYIKPGKNGIRKKETDDLDNKGLTEALDLLKAAFESLTSYLKDEQKEKEEISAKVRINEDAVDRTASVSVFLTDNLA